MLSCVCYVCPVCGEEAETLFHFVGLCPVFFVRSNIFFGFPSICLDQTLSYNGVLYNNAFTTVFFLQILENY